VHDVKSLVFFNNKGGVGKTTLACNVVSYLNLKRNLKVLLVDADPQCNASQAMLADDVLQEIYLDGSASIKTLHTYLSPVGAGDSDIQTPIEPLPANENRFGTPLIPGHPNMSLVEDQLSSAWGDLQASKLRGFRITNWVAQLLPSFAEYDLVVFDVGPSLGALNRTVLLGCDYVVTPFGCDIFSLLGIRNISSWIANWKRQYERALANLNEDEPGVVAGYPVITNLDLKFRFAGYSVQQYVTKTFKTGKRPVRAYEQIMAMIPSTVQDSLQQLTRAGASAEQLSLGHIPFLYSLVPLAQSNRVPVHMLAEVGAIVGSQGKQVEDFDRIISSFCDKLLANIGVAT
jgi:cellulose biosynthesis protein BcsQ